MGSLLHAASVLRPIVQQQFQIPYLSPSKPPASTRWRKLLYTGAMDIPPEGMD